MTQIKAGHYA